MFEVKFDDSDSLRMLYDRNGIKTWKTADGRVIPYTLLEDDHLDNIVRWLSERIHQDFVRYLGDSIGINSFDAYSQAIGNVLKLKWPEIADECDKRQRTWMALVRGTLEPLFKAVFAIEIDEDKLFSSEVVSTIHKEMMKEVKKETKRLKTSKSFIPIPEAVSKELVEELEKMARARDEKVRKQRRSKAKARKVRS